MKKTKARVLLSIFLYIVCVVGYAVWFSFEEKRNFISAVDERLLIAAKNIKYLLAPDFHDRAVAADSIPWEEIERNRIAVSNFAFETDYEYIYTLVEKDGAFFFSAPTVTPEEYAELKSWYFYPYEDIPEGFRYAYEHSEPVYVTYTDQWGTFRSVAIPEVSPGGNRYLACADYDISYISRAMVHYYVISLLTALYFLTLTIPFILSYRRTLFIHNARLRSVNTKLTEYQDHLEALVEQRTSALEREKIKAEDANRLKSRLLFNMSHELRTPLNGISGYCEALKDTDDINLAHDYSAVIQREADILLALINDLLDLAKIEAGKMDITKVPINIREFIEDTLKGQMVLARKKDLDFLWSVDTDIPEILYGDSLKIRQIILNLVSNAIKFTDTGFVRVTVKSKGQKQNLQKIYFEVRDTGIGIPRDKLTTIFGSFSQADPSITRRFGGTGLGVSIASQLVTLMDGRMEVESEPGAGSLFFFTLSLDIEPPPDLMGKDLPLETPETAGPDLSGSGNILLVDDYPTNLHLLSLFLTKAGYTTTKVDNGMKAVEYCSEKAFDCIFIDIQMPGMDGYETVRSIRSSSVLNKTTPIIGVSASGDESTWKKCLESGMNDFILKPIKKGKILFLASYWTKNIPHEQPGGSGDDTGISGKPEGLLFDHQKMLQTFEYDLELFHEALKIFMEMLQEEVAAIREAIELEDMKTLYRSAHKIKGSAAIMEIQEITDKAAELEKIGHFLDDNQMKPDKRLPALLDELQVLVQRFNACAEEYLEEVHL